MEGGVETLSYFSHQMAGEFQKLGYAVFFYDLKQEESSAGKLRKFIRPRETVLVTFNFQGLEKEAGVYREGIGYLWDTYHIPCYNIAADHPYFYDDRLKDLPEKYRHISIDRRQKAYFEEFYPEYVSRGFLPLAGTGLRQGEDEAKTGKAGAQGAAVETGEAGAQGAAEQAAPCYDVILTGNYTKLSFFEPYINWINEEYAAFYLWIIDDLLEHPACTVEEVALAHCEREMGKEPNDQLRIALHKMIFIDLYVRNYWRGKAVRTLVNAGIPVPIDTNVIFVPGSLSLILAASSNAYASNGLTILGTPSRISVFFTGSIRISVVSGTCLMQTRIFFIANILHSSLFIYISLIPDGLQ